MRAFTEAQAKLCLAEGIVQKQVPNTLKYCQIKDSYPKDYSWQDKADDLVGLAQILPFAQVGEYYYSQNQPQKSAYYYQQVINHQKYLQLKGFDGLLDYQDLQKIAHDRTGQSNYPVPTLVSLSNWQVHSQADMKYSFEFPKTWLIDYSPTSLHVCSSTVGDCLTFQHQPDYSNPTEYRAYLKKHPNPNLTDITPGSVFIKGKSYDTIKESTGKETQVVIFMTTPTGKPLAVQYSDAGPFQNYFDQILTTITFLK
jgi:hypothetical protein